MKRCGWMPRTAGHRGSFSGLLALGLCFALVVGLTGGADAAKKKGKGGKAKVFAKQVTPNAPIPEGAAAGGVSTPVDSTITVPKKFKGLNVGDVNVTGIQTTGSASGAANDLIARLTAPNGRTLVLFNLKGDQSLGPWTLDDDTKTEICDVAVGTVCANPLQLLYRPFAGTSNLARTDNPSWLPLAMLNGVPMRGTWTFRIVDLTNAGGTTSVLNSWGLRITPAKAGAG